MVAAVIPVEVSPGSVTAANAASARGLPSTSTSKSAAVRPVTGRRSLSSTVTVNCTTSMPPRKRGMCCCEAMAIAAVTKTESDDSTHLVRIISFPKTPLKRDMPARPNRRRRNVGAEQRSWWPEGRECRRAAQTSENPQGANLIGSTMTAREAKPFALAGCAFGPRARLREPDRVLAESAR